MKTHTTREGGFSMTARNDLFPTTANMTDADVHRRQLNSRRVTVTARRVPTHLRLNTPRRLVTNANER
jgi:hypothetical protein